MTTTDEYFASAAASTTTATADAPTANTATTNLC